MQRYKDFEIRLTGDIIRLVGVKDKKIKQIDVKKVILGNLKVMFVATSSILVRKNIFDKPYSFYKELFRLFKRD